jgi:hypothetical protein
MIHLPRPQGVAPASAGFGPCRVVLLLDRHLPRRVQFRSEVPVKLTVKNPEKAEVEGRFTFVYHFLPPLRLCVRQGVD